LKHKIKLDFIELDLNIKHKTKIYISSTHKKLCTVEDNQTTNRSTYTV